MNAKFLPTAMIVLAYGASIVCFAQHDWRRGLYWLCAGTLNLTVTY